MRSTSAVFIAALAASASAAAIPAPIATGSKAAAAALSTADLKNSTKQLADLKNSTAAAANITSSAVDKVNSTMDKAKSDPELAGAEKAAASALSGEEEEELATAIAAYLAETYGSVDTAYSKLGLKRRSDPYFPFDIERAIAAFFGNRPGNQQNSNKYSNEDDLSGRLTPRGQKDVDPATAEAVRKYLAAFSHRKRQVAGVDIRAKLGEIGDIDLPFGVGKRQVEVDDGADANEGDSGYGGLFKRKDAGTLPLGVVGDVVKREDAGSLPDEVLRALNGLGKRQITIHNGHPEENEDEFPYIDFHKRQFPGLDVENDAADTGFDAANDAAGAGEDLVDGAVDLAGGVLGSIFGKRQVVDVDGHTTVPHNSNENGDFTEPQAAEDNLLGGILKKRDALPVRGQNGGRRAYKGNLSSGDILEDALRKRQAVVSNGHANVHTPGDAESGVSGVPDVSDIPDVAEPQPEEPQLGEDGLLGGLLRKRQVVVSNGHADVPTPGHAESGVSGVPDVSDVPGVAEEPQSGEDGLLDGLLRKRQVVVSNGHADVPTPGHAESGVSGVPDVFDIPNVAEPQPEEPQLGEDGLLGGLYGKRQATEFNIPGLYPGGSDVQNVPEATEPLSDDGGSDFQNFPEAPEPQSDESQFGHGGLIPGLTGSLRKRGDVRYGGKLGLNGNAVAAPVAAENSEASDLDKYVGGLLGKRQLGEFGNELNDNGDGVGGTIDVLGVKLGAGASFDKRQFGSEDGLGDALSNKIEEDSGIGGGVDFFGVKAGAGIDFDKRQFDGENGLGAGLNQGDDKDSVGGDIDFFGINAGAGLSFDRRN